MHQSRSKRLPAYPNRVIVGSPHRMRYVLRSISGLTRNQEAQVAPNFAFTLTPRDRFTYTGFSGPTERETLEWLTHVCPICF